MIQTVEGRIGGGKTYMVAGWICNHLARGGIVATNINLQLEAFEDQYGEKIGLRAVLKLHFGYVLKDSQIIRLSDLKKVPYTKEGGKVVELKEITMFYKLVPRGTPDMPLMVVIDEAHIHFPQDGYRTIPREVLEFLTLSRHAGVDVVFISQHIKNMWCQMFRLSEFRWGVRDMKKYGFQWMFINWPWFFPHFLMVKKDFEGDRMLSKMEWHKKYLYEVYRSPEIASQFESMPMASKVEIERVGLTVKQKIMLFGGGFLCCILLFGMPACISSGRQTDRISSLEHSLTNVVAVSVDPVPSSAFAVTSDPSDPAPVWLYAGHIDSGWDSKLWISCDGVTRTYLIGDLYEGIPVVKVGDHMIMTFDVESQEYARHHVD